MHVLLVLFYIRLGIDTLAIARDVEICDIFTIMLQYFNGIHFLVFSLSVHHAQLEKELFVFSMYSEH